MGRRWFGSGLVSVLVVACSSSFHTDGSVDDRDAASADAGVSRCGELPPDPAITEEEFLAERSRLVCAGSIQCEPFDLPSAVCHPDARLGLGVPQFDPWVPCPGDVFNPHAAVRCLEALAEPGCHFAPREDIDSCSDVYGPPPAPCSTCRVWGCGPELHCDAVDGCRGPSCVRRCRPRGEVGDECEDVSLRAGASRGCRRGLDCVAGLGAFTGTCLERTHSGDPCREGADGSRCSFPLHCIDDSCGGHAENAGDRCGLASCLGELHCVGTYETSFCEVGAATGEACGERFCFVCEERRCAAGNRCVDEVCVRIVGPGEACAESRECPTAFHCEAGACIADPTEGGACSAEIPCARGACRDGVCALLGEGEPCEWLSSDWPEGLGQCAVGACWEEVCPTVVPLGGRCPTDSELFTHSCDAGLACDYETDTCAPAEDLYCVF